MANDTNFLYLFNHFILQKILRLYNLKNLLLMKMKLLFAFGLLAVFALTQCKSDKNSKEQQATENVEATTGFGDSKCAIYDSRHNVYSDT